MGQYGLRGRGGGVDVLDVEIDEAAICCGCDSGLQDTEILGSDGAVCAIIGRSFDIRCGRNVEDIDVAVDRGRDRLSMTSARVPRQNKELSILNMEDFGLGSNLGVL